MPKVTIEDISRHTGLSRGTVSRALNDKHDISEKTKQRVLEACRTLNYVPSRAARTLATGRNLAVAVIMNRLDTSFSAAYMRGVLDAADGAQYAVLTVELGLRRDVALDRVRALTPDRIDGVLVATDLDSESASKLRQAVGERNVASCARIPGIECDVLAPDYAEVGRLAARFLLAAHTDAVVYLYSAEDAGNQERLTGFCEAYARHDPAAVTLKLEASTRLSDVLGPRADNVQAIAASSDGLALGAAMFLCARGRSIANEVAILGQGNDPILSAVQVPVSTIDLSGEEIGRRSMETVLQRIEGSRMDTPQTTLIAPRLIEHPS